MTGDFWMAVVPPCGAVASSYMALGDPGFDILDMSDPTEPGQAVPGFAGPKSLRIPGTRNSGDTIPNS